MFIVWPCLLWVVHVGGELVCMHIWQKVLLRDLSLGCSGVSYMQMVIYWLRFDSFSLQDDGFGWDYKRFYGIFLWKFIDYG